MTDFLKQAYESFAIKLFDAEFPSVSFQVNLARKHVFFYRHPGVIEIGSEFIDASDQDILDALLHAMVHVFNRKNGIDDLTDNLYHKSAFCTQALRVGLHVKFQKGRGWACVSSDSSRFSGESKYRKAQEDGEKLRSKAYEDLEFFEENCKQLRSELSKQDRKVRSITYRYICCCDPPMIVRVGRRPDGAVPFDATCNRCGEKFALTRKNSCVE